MGDDVLGDDVLVVFLRWPEAGKAKTRLIPLLGAPGAARLYQRFAEAMIRTATQLHGVRVVAFVEPADRVAEASEWLAPHAARPIEVWPQPPGDLGVRSEAAFDRGFASGARRVVIVGTDLPQLTPEDLSAAFDELAAHDAVIGPATDGGYWLLGLTRPIPAAFRDIPWSTDRAAAVTTERLLEVGAPPARLAEQTDVDTPDDLELALPQWRIWLED